MATLETVKIEYGYEFLVINKSDFDPESHTLFGPEKPPQEEPIQEEPTQEPADSSPTKEQRQAELDEASWQTLKALAEKLDPPITEKPEGGWDEVIPAILLAEFPEE
ncbi:MAG: hypothetical protein AAGA46_00505 [Cyanobacteria bacterium P01_F01_bin.13]